jgi:hypothetical protein
MQNRKFSKSPRHFVKRPTGYRPDFHRYDREKQDYLERNPQATKEMIDQAMRVIAERCGI